jgi:hypothetical protein
MSKAFSLIWRTVLMPASGRKKPKWSGKSLKAQATVSPLVRSSASKSVPSVARMNFALALAVAGLALSAQRLRDLSCVAGQDVDVAGLENAAEVGLVRRPRAQALDGRLLVAKGFKEGIGELCGVKGLLRKVGDGLFDLYGVQHDPPLFAPRLLPQHAERLARPLLRGPRCLAGLRFQGDQGNQDRTAVRGVAGAARSAARAKMEVDLREIGDMSNEKGVKAIIDEAEFHLSEDGAHETFVAMLMALPGHHERAMTTFLDHPRCGRARHASTTPTP